MKIAAEGFIVKQDKSAFKPNLPTMKRLIFLTLFLLGCGTIATAESLPQTLILKNGLQVVFQKRTTSPLVSLELWVRAGAREERNAENGAAHFIEHLVFRRDKKATAESPDTAIENLGATLTAANAPDYTRYTTTIAAAHFGKALAILADVVRNAEFPAKEMELERGVILDELALRESRIDEQIQNALYLQMFPTHPYRFSPGGEKDNIKTLNRETLLSFYRRNYRPDRCVLVVVGNIEAETAASEAMRIFGNWIAPASLPDAPESLPTLASASSLTLYRRSIMPQMGMGWFAPPAERTIEAAAMQILAVILQDRLQKVPNLIDVSIRYTPRVSVSLFQIQAKINVSDTNLAIPLDMSERFAKAEQWVRSKIKELQTLPPTQAEINSAVRRLTGKYVVDTETNSGLAQFLASRVVSNGGISRTPLEEFAAIRPANLLSTARTYLEAGQGIVHLLPDRSPLPKKETKP